MVSAPIMKMAPRTTGKAIGRFLRRNQAQEADRHTPAMTHKDGAGATRTYRPTVQPRTPAQPKEEAAGPKFVFPNSLRNSISSKQSAGRITGEPGETRFLCGTSEEIDQRSGTPQSGTP